LIATGLLAGTLAALCLAAWPGWAQQGDIAAEEKRVVELTNSARSDEGLPPLRISPELRRSAEVKARDMKARGYFAHYSPEGTSPFTLMRETGADFSAAGENLGEGSSVDRIFAAWMESSEHRKNALSPDFTHLGVGVVAQGRLLVVQHFARLRGTTKDYPPQPAPPTPAPPAPAPGQPTASAAGTYVVQPGETLAGIAQRLGVPPWRIIIENGWSVLGELQPGQVIRVPR
jgi:hypothetical protein